MKLLEILAEFMPTNGRTVLRIIGFLIALLLGSYGYWVAKWPGAVLIGGIPIVVIEYFLKLDKSI